MSSPPGRFGWATRWALVGGTAARRLTWRQRRTRTSLLTPTPGGPHRFSPGLANPSAKKCGSREQFPFPCCEA